MKKTILTICITLAMLCLLASCGHEHTYDVWTAAPTSHWHECEECGEQVDMADHTLDADNFCTVCGVAIYSVYENDEEIVEVCRYDEQGAMDLQVGYDSDGKVLYTLYWDNEYYEDGNTKNQKFYQDGVLTSEDRFLYCEDPENGETYLAVSITYNEDGTSEHLEYDEYSTPLRTVIYDKNGNVAHITRYEYKADENGNTEYQATYIDDVLRSEYFYVNTDESSYISRYVSYDENGNIESEYNYDSEGNIIE